jgi:hypothetical protein
MNRLNSHFLRPFPTGSRDVSGDGQSALVVKLRVSPSLRRQLTGPHRYHPGIVQQAQGRSAETAVSPHHNNQSTMAKIRIWERNSFTHSWALQQMEAKWSLSFTSRTLYPQGKKPQVIIWCDSGCAPELVWRHYLKQISCPCRPVRSLVTAARICVLYFYWNVKRV